MGKNGDMFEHTDKTRLASSNRPSMLGVFRALIIGPIIAALVFSVACSAEDGEEESEGLFARLGEGEVLAGYLCEEGPFADHDGRGARAGDIMLKNSKVWFVVAAEDRIKDWYVPYVGGIVDADLVRDEGDPDYVAIGEIHPFVGLAPLKPHSIEIENDGTDGSAAVVRVLGTDGVMNFLSGSVGIPPIEPEGLNIEVRYTLEPDANALEIVTWVYNESPSTKRMDAGDLVILGDDEANQYSLPGGLDRSALIGEPPAIGSVHDFRHWALAIYGEEPLRFIGGDVGAEAFGGSSTVWVYSAARETLRGGERLEARRYLALDRDISSALSGRLEIIGESNGIVSGSVNADGEPVAGGRVTFLRAGDEESFEGQAITGSDGRFSARLPAGEYTAWPTAEGRGEHVKVPWLPLELGEGRPAGDGVEFSVSGGEEVDIDLAVGPVGRVKLTVEDEDGRPIPAKVSFIHEDDGADTTERAVFGETRPFSEHGFRKVFWTADGKIDGEIRPGTYTAVASRGPTYEIDVHESVKVNAKGEPLELSFVLAESVDTWGKTSFDGHQHAAPSPDGGLTMAERVITNVSEGLDAFISTDHDKVVDFRPMVEALDLESTILAIPGTEVSTTLLGHHNTWPMKPDPSLPNMGSPIWWGLPGEDPMTIDEIYVDAAERGARVLQVNHGLSSTGMFAIADYDLETGEVGRPHAWSDNFNAMEVYNGQRRSHRYDLVPIWLSLINEGMRIAPTAVSDSHNRIPEPGSGRTWVLTGEDNPSYVDADMLADGVLNLRTVASTGPFIRFTTECGAGLGELVGMQDSVNFEIEVQAPAWMKLARVELIANGEVEGVWEKGDEGWQEGSVRFSKTITVQPERDTWYAVQVDSDEEMMPVYPGLVPWALTSPIFLDVDGSGGFNPPTR